VNATQKPRRTFLAVTVMTVLAVTAVFIVYASILATYMGSTVTVNTLGGEVQYRVNDNPVGTYTAGAFSINNGTSWYARLYMTGATAQTVKITFTLVCSNSSTWDRVVINSYSLQTGANTIYANATTPNDAASNYNWGQDTDVQSVTQTYYVKATVETA